MLVTPAELCSLDEYIDITLDWEGKASGFQREL